MASRLEPPVPTVVLLVRHGLTPTTGREMPRAGGGPGLSEEGKAQAGEVARLIAGWRAALPRLAGLYTSPLVRTRETAAILGETLGMQVVQSEGLVDCDAGEWAGEPLDQLARKPEWASVVHYPSGFRFPGGEPVAEMGSRVLGTLRRLVAAHPGQTVAVVSHADPIKAALADALGVHLDLFQRIIVSPASVSAVAYSGTGPSVVLMNGTGPSRPLPCKGPTGPDKPLSEQPGGPPRGRH
jgi:probable phosphoglycerate mutase